MSAAAAHAAARQKNKAKKEAAAAKENSPSKWSFRSKKVEDEPAEGIVATDGRRRCRVLEVLPLSGSRTTAHGRLLPQQITLLPARR